jgi:hypothetical protein
LELFRRDQITQSWYKTTPMIYTIWRDQITQSRYKTTPMIYTIWRDQITQSWYKTMPMIYTIWRDQITQNSNNNSPLPSQESERSCICLLGGIDFVSFYDFPRDLRIVPIVWWFCFSFYLFMKHETKSIFEHVITIQQSYKGSENPNMDRNWEWKWVIVIIAFLWFLQDVSRILHYRVSLWRGYP